MSNLLQNIVAQTAALVCTLTNNATNKKPHRLCHPYSPFASKFAIVSRETFSLSMSNPTKNLVAQNAALVCTLTNNATNKKPRRLHHPYSPFASKFAIVSRETFLPQSTNKACSCIGSSNSGVDNTSQPPVFRSTNRLQADLTLHHEKSPDFLPHFYYFPSLNLLDSKRINATVLR